MITDLIKLLNTDKFYGCSKNIDIAKGKNKLPMNAREAYNSIKRRK